MYDSDEDRFLKRGGISILCFAAFAGSIMQLPKEVEKNSQIVADSKRQSTDVYNAAYRSMVPNLDSPKLKAIEAEDSMASRHFVQCVKEQIPPIETFASLEQSRWNISALEVKLDADGIGECFSTAHSQELREQDWGWSLQQFKTTGLFMTVAATPIFGLGFLGGALISFAKHSFRRRETDYDMR